MKVKQLKEILATLDDEDLIFVDHWEGYSIARMAKKVKVYEVSDEEDWDGMQGDYQEFDEADEIKEFKLGLYIGLSDSNEFLD